ncbi:MAG: hypothetical protein ACKV2U_04390 [Bryobacteraceae bacterium]
MRLQASDRSDLEDLKSIVVGSGPGPGEITLNQVARLDLVKTPGTIRRGLSRSDAVLEGRGERLRPILMAACTAICGQPHLRTPLLPLARTVMEACYHRRY